VAVEAPIERPTRTRGDLPEPGPRPEAAPEAPLDELFDSSGQPRPHAAFLSAFLEDLGPAGLLGRQVAAQRQLARLGVTFPLAGDPDPERTWPFDVLPRLVALPEWERLAAGLAQRLVALNAFVADCYGPQEALRAKVVPPEVVLGSRHFEPALLNTSPPAGIWTHVAGTDVVRDGSGQFVVLEDNLRVPSGAAYMLVNRQVSKTVVPEAFREASVLPVEPYLDALGEGLAALRTGSDDDLAVLLTPGPANPAWFEHVFLARQLGIPLVEGADLLVDDQDRLQVRTVEGLRPVDVVYRRVADDYLDPELGRPDSLVGVPGLLRSWRAGRVALANAPGTGVADDKAVYAFVPAIIRFFLDEEPILANVPTWWCGDPEHCRFVLAHLAELVVKPTTEGGGYGVVVGPDVPRESLTAVAARIQQNPAGWVAQPTLELSTTPSLSGDGTLQPRRVDLRTFTVLAPAGATSAAGGLTRVAPFGSRVVNSSQGGSSKDTWVVDDRLPAGRPGARVLPSPLLGPGRPAPLDPRPGRTRDPH
jgi:uncharacterized circularly permuted ATP-grasp superfamily protein